MKNKIFISVIILVIASLPFSGMTNVYGASSFSEKDSLSLVCQPGLFDLAGVWADEYTLSHTGTKVQISVLADQNINISSGGKTIFLAKASGLQLWEGRRYWKETVARDVIVAVVNTSNPYMAEINSRGINPVQLGKLFGSGEKKSWDLLIAGSDVYPLNFYRIADPEMDGMIEKFVNSGLPADFGKSFNDASYMIKALQDDKFGLGFCRIADMMDPDGQFVLPGLAIMPVDRNGNDQLDFAENIYKDLNSFNRGVWIGKYPHELISSIYAIASSKPAGTPEEDFLRWILTEGQKYIPGNGYTELQLAERKSKLENLAAIQPVMSAGKAKYPVFLLLLLVFSGLVLVIFLSDLILRRIRRTRIIENKRILPGLSVFSDSTVAYLPGLYYDKGHSWLFMEKNGNVRIGIDDFLLHVTGTITGLTLKNTGDIIKKGDILLSVHHKGKKINLKSPVSGIITGVNSRVLSYPSILNDSPYEEGWIYTVEVSDWAKEIQTMLMAATYLKWLKTEFTRLREFLTTFIKPGLTVQNQIIMQDGGELTDHPLAELDPIVWEEFQNRFLSSGLK